MMKTTQYKYTFKYFDNVNAKDLKDGYVWLDHRDIYEAEDLFMQYHPDAVVIMILTDGD